MMADTHVNTYKTVMSLNLHHNAKWIKHKSRGARCANGRQGQLNQGQIMKTMGILQITFTTEKCADV
jgi:hypothetical protein